MKSGVDQLNNSTQLLSKIYKNIFSLLILADCRYIDQDFGYSENEVMHNFLSAHEFKIYDDLTILQSTITDPKICIVLDELKISQFIDTYGHPYEDQL